MRLIPLTRGKFAIVDDEDYDWLATWSWQAIDGKHTYYARSSRPKKEGGSVSMHRMLMMYPQKPLMVDHINHDGLDNRKSNLRVVTNRQNSQNKVTYGSSSYPGVYWHGRRRKWEAHIRLGTTTKFLCYLSDEIGAAIVYLAACLLLEQGTPIDQVRQMLKDRYPSLIGNQQQSEDPF